MITQDKWKWFGFAAHYILGSECKFHLATQVGEYLVSTVGALVIKDGNGWQEIGLDRKFETMVFNAGKPCDSMICGCGVPDIDGHELDFMPAKDPGEATESHMKMCKKCARKS